MAKKTNDEQRKREGKEKEEVGGRMMMRLCSRGGTFVVSVSMNKRVVIAHTCMYHTFISTFPPPMNRYEGCTSRQ